jgi:hypothetical protein
MPEADTIPPDMRTALQKFDTAAEAVLGAFVLRIEGQPIPKFIYHYTNDAGLRGILESGAIWITDIFNLNDPSELKHGFSHAARILDEKAATGPPESRTFARIFREFVNQGGIHASAHYFVASLSRNGDELGQWRAYADNGRGYALGFEAKPFEDAFTKEGSAPIPNNSTFPVTYKDSELADLHRQFIELAFPLISLPHGKKLSRNALHSYLEELMVLLTMHALRAAIFFKHEGYANEEEYRLFQVFRADLPAPDVKIRSRPYSLVKYREFNWRARAPSSLVRIVVGPAADPEKATQFVRDCMKTYELGSVEIVRSSIPYRAT